MKIDLLSCCLGQMESIPAVIRRRQKDTLDTLPVHSNFLLYNFSSIIYKLELLRNSVFNIIHLHSSLCFTESTIVDTCTHTRMHTHTRARTHLNLPLNGSLLPVIAFAVLHIKQSICSEPEQVLAPNQSDYLKLQLLSSFPGQNVMAHCQNIFFNRLLLIIPVFK